MTGVSIQDLEPDLDQSVVRAKTLATLAHRGQFGKDGEPHINHPLRVVGYLPDVLDGLDDVGFEVNVVSLSTLETIAWLHNVLEWTWVTEEILRKMFDSIVVGAVVRMTRGYYSTDNPAYEQRHDMPTGSEYYRLVRADPWARIVEVADLLDHTEPARMQALSQQDRLSSSKEAWMSAKALDAAEFVNPFNAQRWQAYYTAHPGSHAGPEENPNKESH